MASCTFLSLVNPLIKCTGPHERDPSVLDYTHPSGDGEPPWSNAPDERFAFDPNFDEFGDYTQRAIQTLSIFNDSSSTLTPCPTLMNNQHVFRTYQHDVSHETPDYEKFRPYLVGSMWILFRKPWNSLPNGESPYPILSLWKNI